MHVLKERQMKRQKVKKRLNDYNKTFLEKSGCHMHCMLSSFEMFKVQLVVKSQTV